MNAYIDGMNIKEDFEVKLPHHKSSLQIDLRKRNNITAQSKFYENRYVSPSNDGGNRNYYSSAISQSMSNTIYKTKN